MIPSTSAMIFNVWERTDPWEWFAVEPDPLLLTRLASFFDLEWPEFSFVDNVFCGDRSFDFVETSFVRPLSFCVR